jgi:hypothetical protein
VNGQPWEAYVDIGLLDTMKDLIVNLIGAVVFSVFGYFYVKRRGRGHFVQRFLLRHMDEETKCAAGKEKPQ